MKDFTLTITDWGPRSLLDLDYSWCCMCFQYTRDKEEHTYNHCEAYFIMSYRSNSTKNNALFEIKPPDYSVKSLPPFRSYAQARAIRLQEELERHFVLQEIEAEAKKAWIESRRALKEKKARMREEANEHAASSKQTRKITKKVIDKCKRVRDNARDDDNEPLTKNAKTQTGSSSSDAEEVVPNDPKKTTQFFKLVGSTSQEMAEPHGTTTDERDECEVIMGK